MADNNFRSDRSRDPLAELARLIGQAEVTNLGFAVRLEVHDHGGRGPIVQRSARHTHPASPLRTPLPLC